jgi:inosine-uridine nucleoside N-ribohydrolase
MTRIRNLFTVALTLSILACGDEALAPPPAGKPTGTGGSDAGHARSDTGSSMAVGPGGSTKNAPPEAGTASSPVDAAPDPVDTSDAPQGPTLPNIIVDSDANNEMDDQHAIAYALFNADIWHIDGITTNATSSGGPAPEDTKEAVRVVKLCASDSTVSVYTGATDDYPQIRGNLGDASYDGQAAVEFIIARARLHGPSDKLILVCIGKLTNIALAIEKEPSITKSARVFWLGSNWPNAGEYNLENDPDAVRRVVDSDIELDIATVRYDGQPEPGTASVTVTLDQMKANMKGKGPEVAPVEGRNGGTFTHFGDYSIDLMSHIGDVRALYDMAAVATLKNPKWATMQEVPAPSLDGIGWKDRPDNTRKIRFWHSFDHDAIVSELFSVMAHPKIQ